MKHKNQSAHFILVGLNSPDGTVLKFELLTPNSNTNISDIDLQFWKDFLNNTTQLKGYLYYKALGQDLRQGLTITDLALAKYNFIAEKRLSDQKLRIVVEPLTEGSKFDVREIYTKLMCDEWNLGAPIAKIDGIYYTKLSNISTVEDYVITVLIKDVEEFTYGPDYVDNHPKVAIYDVDLSKNP